MMRDTHARDLKAARAEAQQALQPADAQRRARGRRGGLWPGSGPRGGGNSVPAADDLRRVLRRAARRPRATWGLVAAGALLAGCVADTRPSDQYLAVHGYWYHDANHPNGGGEQASQQAIYSATHGVWLWPPAAIRDSPN